MSSLWNVLRLFRIYFVLSIQNSFYEADALHGILVNEATSEEGKNLPFIVSLTDKARLHGCKKSFFFFATEYAHFCGGSLITNSHILTAAHCFMTYGDRFDEVVVKIGSIDLRKVDDVHAVSWWRTYSQHHNVQLFNENGTDIKDKIFDIAVMKLKNPVSLDFPLPALLYMSNKDLTARMVVIGGWGFTEERYTPPTMRIGQTITLPKCVLKDFEGTVKDVDKMFFCSDLFMAHTDNGDSGTPVLYDGENFDYPNSIVGIVTADNEENNIHISINFFRSFIESVTQL